MPASIAATAWVILRVTKVSPVIRETSDEGRPIVVSQPDSEQAQAYRRIAVRIAEKVDAALGAAGRKPPKIVIH